MASDDRERRWRQSSPAELFDRLTGRNLPLKVVLFAAGLVTAISNQERLGEVVVNTYAETDPFTEFSKVYPQQIGVDRITVRP
ncbi:hypothetical protein [Streptomyces boluensis]|uniref:Uncharacterized protein n=1 Tax=Streptomyces boluensis TaxID=1775135 RepID=A0A964UJZ4_9ACTN|nr:hypothetical protein [Streptomyces boluensis]NBE50494.1 hypothetical protein [Streptomyces boluensis]